MEPKEQINLSSDGSKNDDKGDFQELLEELGRQTLTFWYGRRMFQYQGFWFTDFTLRQVLSVQKTFEAKNTDVILASFPKSGTTWLKALTFAIATRHAYSVDQSPLLTSNPHNLVPFLEYHASNPRVQENPHPEGSILSTHIPFKSLPESVHESECKIIYICRHPLDVLVSSHYFLKGNNFNMNIGDLSELFEVLYGGVYDVGPVWNHILEYWNVHRGNPRKVLFLKYEDLKEDIGFNVDKIAEFLGLPFSEEERRRGRIDEISTLCSFKKLSGLEVNNTGSTKFVDFPAIKNSSFFRKGDVGDWRNHVTPDMAERFKKVMETELKDSGLTFET